MKPSLSLICGCSNESHTVVGVSWEGGTNTDYIYHLRC